MKRQKVRIDQLMVQRGLVESRSRAQALILAGKILVDERPVTKPGMFIEDREDFEIRIRGGDLPYVSRGGLKLRGALDRFPEIEVRGRLVLDVGASTGGFTDCVLQAGAQRVYAVDVGYGQMAWKLAQDPRVVVLDRRNIRNMPKSDVPEAIELVVADCSFISATKIIPHFATFMAKQAEALVLVKPQFEVGRQKIGKGGIVRAETDAQEARDQVGAFFESHGYRVRGTCESPIRGRDGNREYFLWATRLLEKCGPDSPNDL